MNYRVFFKTTFFSVTTLNFWSRKCFYFEISWLVSTPMRKVGKPQADDGMTAVRMDPSTRLVIFGLCLLQPFSAENITCTGTQHADQTSYNIQHIEGVDAVDEYSWTKYVPNVNGTDHHVIAHHKGKADKCVKSNSNSTLVTTKCFERVDYEVTYIQGGDFLTMTTTCNITCSEYALPQQTDQETSWHPWMTAVVVVGITLLLIGAYLCYKYRTFKRFCSCTQRIYAPVKMQKAAPEVILV
ncbi:uncharacterized protein LOC108897978 [Lates calcarifer]|uniref:Uncharacterized protein LOC108897978 n=1 Tax=Lates calcarifer TaxID=8187 RepID=A0AAJ7VH01_LATCA|nr:uncharacterized protein LOC108897978 [Lates calcarifer]